MAGNNENSELNTKPLLISVFLRTFLLRTMASYTKMLGLGFGLCMIPFAKAKGLRGEALKDFYRRHFDYFNSHPITSAYVLGVAGKMEIARKNPDDIVKVKRSIMGPLSLLGDQFFESRLKPLIMTAAITGLLFCQTSSENALFYQIFILICALLAYNAVNFIIRWQGISRGFKNAAAVIRNITRSRFVRYRLHLSLAAAFTSAVFFMKTASLSGEKIVFFSAFVAAIIGVRMKVSIWITLLFTLSVIIGSTFLAEFIFIG